MLAFAEGVAEVMFKFVGIMMKYAPIGIGAAMAVTVSHSGLGVLGELRADPAGVLHAVTPGENLDPETGTRVAPGRIQFGLTAPEIDGIATRLEELLARIDAGELGVF